MFCVFVLAVCLTAQHVNAEYSQFLYSGFPTPIQSVQPNYYQAPVTYQSFVPQFPTPATTYSSFAPQVFPAHQTFGYHQNFPLQYTYTPTVQVSHDVTTPGPSDSERSTTTTTTVAPSTEENYNNNQEIIEPEPEKDDSVITNAPFRTNSLINYVDNSIDNFRGFAYRNDFEGGRSHFVFITGPEAHQYRQSQIQTPTTSFRTSASDAVDSLASSSSKNEENHSIDALIKYLENPEIGVQRFYSINNALVSRRIEDEIPALPVPFATFQGSLPITQPISPLFTLLRSSFQLNVETTTTKSQDGNDERESLANQIASETSTTAATTLKQESTTTTDSTSTTPTTSTSSSKSETTSSTVATTNETTEKSTMQPIVIE